MKMAPIPAWLDEATSALVEETVTMLIKRHANILLAMILLTTPTGCATSFDR